MATLSDLGIVGIGTGILHPKQKNKWRVTFASFGAGDGLPVSMQAITASRPSISYDEVQLDRYNGRVFIPGKYTWDPISMTVEDDVTGTASGAIQAQHQKQQQLIGAGGQFYPTAPDGRSMKFIMNLDQLDGNQTVLEKWVLEGCWLQAVNWGDNDSSTGDAITIELTIRFDHARQDLTGQGVPGLAA